MHVFTWRGVIGRVVCHVVCVDVDLHCALLQRQREKRRGQQLSACLPQRLGGELGGCLVQAVVAHGVASVEDIHVCQLLAIRIRQRLRAGRAVLVGRPDFVKNSSSRDAA